MSSVFRGDSKRSPFEVLRVRSLDPEDFECPTGCLGFMLLLSLNLRKVLLLISFNSKVK